MKRLFLTIFSLTFALSSCTTLTNDQVIQTAIAQTRQVITETASPTKVTIPTLTPSSALTSTEPPPPTQDTQIIPEDQPQKFMLDHSDLPAEGRYFLPETDYNLTESKYLAPGFYSYMANDWCVQATAEVANLNNRRDVLVEQCSSPDLNSEVISNWGVKAGRDYVIKTGRVMGWWVTYIRGNTSSLTPRVIRNEVNMYQTGEGARLAISKYGMTGRQTGNCSIYNNIYEWVFSNVKSRAARKVVKGTYCSEYNSSTWTIVAECPNDLGDTCLMGVVHKLNAVSDDVIWYEFDYSYRNYRMTLSVSGVEREMSFDYAEDLARKLLDKLKTAPLGTPEPPSPTPTLQLTRTSTPEP